MGVGRSGNAVETKPSIDVVYDNLRNQRRRTVVETLATESQTSPSALAETLATVANQCDVDQVTDLQRKRGMVLCTSAASR